MTFSVLARRFWIWAPAAAYVALIFHLSSESRVPWAAPYPDFLLHGAEYLILAVLVARGVNGGLERPVPERRLAIAWTLCVLYAISDELHQTFVPGRTADYRDLLADIAGTVLGLLALQIGQRLLLRGRVA